MTDIVEQLREKAMWRAYDVHGDLHTAAADEIERLREALTSVLDAANCPYEVARAALSPAQDVGGSR